MEEWERKRTEEALAREDFELMVERLLEILAAYPSGAKDRLVAKEYRQRFAADLPANWVKTLKDVPEIDAIQGIGDAALLCAVPAATVEAASQAASQAASRARKTRFALNILQEREFPVSSTSPSSSTDSAPDPPTDLSTSAEALGQAVGKRPAELSAFIREATPEGPAHQAAVFLAAFSAGILYVRLEAHWAAFRELCQDMGELYEERRAGVHLRSFPRSREAYAARLEGEEGWQRVLVANDPGPAASDARPNAPPSDEQLAQTMTLFALDLGRYVHCPVSAMRELDAELLRFPTLALPVALKNVAVSPVDDAALDRLSDLLKDAGTLQLRFQPSGLAKGGWARAGASYVVTIQDINVLSEVSLASYVEAVEAKVKPPAPAPPPADPVQRPEQLRPKKALDGSGTVEKKTGELGRRVRRLELSSVPLAGAAPEAKRPNASPQPQTERQTTGVLTEMTPATPVSSPVPAEEVGLPAEDVEARERDIRAFAAQRPGWLVASEVPAERSFEVFVTFAPEPNEFSFQLKSAWPAPEYVKDLLAKELGDSEPLERPPSRGFYAAWDGEAGAWERVWVEESRPRLTPVFKVDSGEFSAVRSADLRALPASAAVVKEMLGLKGRLGLGPPKGQSHWSQASVAAFGRLVGNRFVRAEVVGAAGTWERAGAPPLPLLHLRLVDQGQDVAQALVAAGLASPIDH